MPTPFGRPVWEPLFTLLDLDVDDNSTDPTTAVDIGNLVGAASLKHLASTNMNAPVCWAAQRHSPPRLDG